MKQRNPICDNRRPEGKPEKYDRQVQAQALTSIMRNGKLYLSGDRFNMWYSDFYSAKAMGYVW